MSVLGYWFRCAGWLWGQGDMDAGAPEWQCLGQEGPLGERQPLGCRDCRRWWAWETQCTRTSLFGTSLPKCPLAELQQQKLRNCPCEMLNLPSVSERKRNVFAFIVSPSVDTAIYLQILLSLKSLHTHLYRGSSFLEYCSWKRVSIYLWHAASCKLNQLLLKAFETRSHWFYGNTRGFNYWDRKVAGQETQSVFMACLLQSWCNFKKLIAFCLPNAQNLIF